MKPMYTDDSEYTVLVIDKVYHLRFTMRAAYLLEKRYGSLESAVTKLNTGDPSDVILATMDFLNAISRVEYEAITEWLNTGKFAGAAAAIRKTAKHDFPPGESSGNAEAGDTSWDWDEMYFIARYRLNMTDAEFWNCTPRRFWKLTKLWVKYNVPGVANSLDDYQEKEIFTGAMFSGGKKLRAVK